MSIFRDSFFVTFGKAYKNVLALGFTMIIARMFTADEYGTYRQAMLICTFVNQLFLLGFPEVVSYYYQIIDQPKRNSLISNTLLFKAAASVIVFLALQLGGAWLTGLMNNPELMRYMFWISLLSAVFVFNSIIEQFYIAAGRSVLMGKYQVLLFTLYYAVAILVTFWKKDLLFLLYSMTAVELIRTVVMYAHIFRIERFKFHFDGRFFIQMLRFALPMGVAALIGTLNRDIDKLMVSNAFSPGDFAVFNNAAMNLPIIELIAVSVGSVIFPHLSRLTKEKGFREAASLFSNTADSTALLLYPLFWLFMVFPEGYIEFLFSDKYLAAIPIFRVYLLRMLITIALYTSLLILSNRKRVVVRIAIACVVTNVALNYFFLHWFGMIGAAIATDVAEVVFFTLTLSQACKAGKVGFGEVFHYRKLFTILGIPAVTALLMKGTSMLLPLGRIGDFFVYGSILVLASFYAYFRIGFVERSWIDRLFKRT